MLKSALRVIVLGLVSVSASSCASTRFVGKTDYPSGCFRDSPNRVWEMEQIIGAGANVGILRDTVSWIRDVDAECEAQRARPWWRLW